MSKNINQVFIANPITSNQSLDLMYFGRSPYGLTDDVAMTYANFAAQFGSPYTPAAMTEVSDTNVTLTLGGTPSTSLLHAVSLTMGWSGTLSGARGGLAAAITASAGGIYYSTSTTGALLAGTATALLPLLSGSSAPPAWGAFALSMGGAITTAGALTTVGAFGVTFTFTGITGVTFPTSGTLATTAGTVAVATTVATTPVSNNATYYPVMVSATSGNQAIDLVTAFTFNPSTGNLTATTFTGALVGNASTATNVASIAATSLYGNATGSPAVGEAIALGTGLSFTGTTLNVTGLGSWVDETGSSVTMTTNTGYTSDDGASLVTFTLPTTSAIGDFVEINGKGAGGWSIAQATGQQIHFGSSTTTSGSGGSLASSNQYDCVRLRCLTANTIWTVVSVVGNLTVV